MFILKSGENFFVPHGEMPKDSVVMPQNQLSVGMSVIFLTIVKTKS
jgi:hypothetical protein